MKCSKKIISFSLWGTNLKYLIGAIKNAELAKKIYPSWVCRFYVGRSTLENASIYINKLECFDNVEVFKMNDDGDWEGMFWRFLPIADSEVDIMISRDADSRLSLRERAAVDEWLKSDKKFHIIRDHPYHNFKILGGMWGARKGVLSDMKTLVDNYKKGNYWQVDQEFLAEIIYPRINSEAFVHDEFGGGRKIPKKRKDFEFVGDVYDQFDNRDNKLRDVLKEYLDYHRSDICFLQRVKVLLRHLK